MKQAAGWLAIFAAATACLWVGFKIAPEDAALRTLGLFLYFYVCVELATQYFISRKKEKEKNGEKGGKA